MLLALCFLLFAGVNTANTRIMKSSETASFHGEANRQKRAPVNLSLSNGNGTKTANFELQMQNASNKTIVLGQRIMVPKSQHTQQVNPVNNKPQMKNASNDATFLNTRRKSKMQGVYGNALPKGLKSRAMQNIRKDAYTIRFDKERGLPLYSAYVLKAEDANDLQTLQPTWKKDRTNKVFTEGEYKDIYRALASRKKPLQKGHLNPAHLNSYDTGKWRDTYSFENAVPQYREFNTGPWRTGEIRLLDFVHDRCANGVVYFLTGVSDNYVGNKPQNDWHDKDFQAPIGKFGKGGKGGNIKNIKTPGRFKKIKKRPKSGKGKKSGKGEKRGGMKIPNSMWTAACCVHIDGLAESVAVMGNNVPYKTKMQQLTLDELQHKLGKDVHLFPHNGNACEKPSDYKLWD